MRIAIVGGGPAGLYLGRLVKLHMPQHGVDIFEQNAPDATFGFGVGIGGKARDMIRAVDPDLHDRIAAKMIFGRSQRIHLNGSDILLDYGQTGGAIERLDLLATLQDACREVGVNVTHGLRVEHLESLRGHDMIVGADGINSIVRRLHSDAFGTSIRYLTNSFAWYGVGRAMRPGSLVFRTVNSCRYVGHYYPYTDAMSTFVAECDAATWQSSGLSEMTDDQRRLFVQQIFADELQGAPLIDNRSIWRNFPVITNRHWHSGNMVLIGDALLSAHFSIGSGTRLSMDDAMALFAAIKDTGSVAAALETYEQIRRPVRERFRLAAEASFMWYERLAEVMDQQPIDFVYDFLTRTGRVDDARLASYAPGFFKLYTERRGLQPARSEA
jgi:2-polyprenyl-6-methoxyphenol hydroxylase-like FAD-dependent oxidoreductase